MKKNRILTVFFLSFFLFPSFTASGFDYHNSIDYTFENPININPYDYTGEKITVSFLQGSVITILDIMNSSKQSFSVQIPTTYSYQITSLKVAHINDSAFILAYTFYNNGVKVLKSFKYSNNVVSNISQSFQVNDYKNYDLFTFQSHNYLYLMNDTYLSIYSYNESSNTWLNAFDYNITNWSVYDFGMTTDTIIFGLLYELTPKEAKILVLDSAPSFQLKNEYVLQSYAPSIAPLNDTFLVVNNSVLLEINSSTNSTTVLSNDIESIPYNYPAKIRAFSNQEIVIQNGNYLSAYLIVNNLLSLAWHTSILDTYLFQIFPSTRELMIFIRHQNSQSVNPNSVYLILSSGMSDPSSDINYFHSYDNSISTETYYSYFSSSSSGDNFGPGFLFGIIFSSFLAGLVFIYSRSHSRRKKVRNGFSKQRPNQSTIATNKVICFNCRTKLEDGSVYCSHCGQNQTESKSI